MKIWSPKPAQNVNKSRIGAAENDLTIIERLKRCIKEKMGWWMKFRF